MAPRDDVAGKKKASSLSNLESRREGPFGEEITHVVCVRAGPRGERETRSSDTSVTVQLVFRSGLGSVGLSTHTNTVQGAEVVVGDTLEL